MRQNAVLWSVCGPSGVPGRGCRQADTPDRSPPAWEAARPARLPGSFRKVPGQRPFLLCSTTRCDAVVLARCGTDVARPRLQAPQQPRFARHRLRYHGRRLGAGENGRVAYLAVDWADVARPCIVVDRQVIGTPSAPQGRPTQSRRGPRPSLARPADVDLPESPERLPRCPGRAGLPSSPGGGRGV